MRVTLTLKLVTTVGLLVWIGLPTGAIFAQEDTSESEHDSPPISTQAERKKVKPRPSTWFPDYPTDKFAWVLQPIVAFKYTQGVNEETGTTKTTTVEGGLAAGLRGVPVVPGNPGLTTGPRIGAAYGYSKSEVNDPAGNKSDAGFHYRRQWGGLDNAVYYKSFRYGLDLTRGYLKVVEDGDRKIQSFRANNDFGLMFKTWLSGHYTFSHARAYSSGFYSPFLVENDHWLHSRIAFRFLDFFLDLGPGFTEVNAWDLAGKEKVGSGTVNYFLMRNRFTLFWKLVGEGIGKYAINASEKRLGLYATERLPEEDLNEPATLAMPEDSFLGSMFFGVKDIIFGIGAGWRYNIQVLNVSERGNSKRETTKDHSFGLYYEVRL